MYKIYYHEIIKTMVPQVLKLQFGCEVQNYEKDSYRNVLNIVVDFGKSWFLLLINLISFTLLSSKSIGVFE